MSDRHESRSREHPLSLPVFLLSLAMFLLLVFQALQLSRDHGTLSDLRTGQENTVREAIKVRQQLETLAGKTAQLALDGDAAARGVVEEMRRQGVNMTPPPKQP